MTEKENLSVFGDKLTPVQILAIDFIHKCKEELKRHGIFIRSAEELEFILEDDKHNPAYDGIHILAFEKELQKALPHNVEKFGYENTRITQPRMQYELNIADQADIHHLHKADLYDPASVALATHHAKHGAI